MAEGSPISGIRATSAITLCREPNKQAHIRRTGCPSVTAHRADVRSITAHSAMTAARSPALS